MRGAEAAGSVNPTSQLLPLETKRMTEHTRSERCRNIAFVTRELINTAGLMAQRLPHEDQHDHFLLVAAPPSIFHCDEELAGTPAALNDTPTVMSYEYKTALQVVYEVANQEVQT